MGTSNAFGGQGNNTPLIPTWLEPETPITPVQPNTVPPDMDEDIPTPVLPPANLPLIEPPPTPNRFAPARTNMTRFISSGGNDNASLGRAISHYIRTSSGGARRAARRMGSSRKSAGRLIGFLSDASIRGEDEALQSLNLEDLAGLPISDVFLGMVDYICPDGGSIDEGIARNAFIETMAELAEIGEVNLDALNQEQTKTVLELYISHTIEFRLYNDIATKIIRVPSDVRRALTVQKQINDFIRRGVADALTDANDKMRQLTKDNLNEFVNRVYEDTFTILLSLSKLEGEAV